VLNGKPDVSPETARRVREAMDELGFVPSRRAVALAKGRANCIGMLVPSLAWPVTLSVLRGVSDAVENSNYGLMLHSMTRSEDAIRDFTNQVVRAQQIDGLVVFIPPGMLDFLEELYQNGLPMVLIDDRGFDPIFPSVTSNSFAGAYSATQHLLQTGRRRIAFINGPGEFGCSQERLAGYKKALFEAEIAIDPELIGRGDFLLNSGLQGVQSLLSKGIHFDALFAASDLMAIGAMKALGKAGLQISGDVAVVGFDDVDAAICTTPSLTTVHQPFYEMGKTAVSLLLDHLNGSTLPDSPVTLPTSLVVRESTTAQLV
jgi:LacI family transcriptional regulator